MSPLEFQKILIKSGFKSERHSTGHPDWTRTFIKKNGVSYGRASFLHSQLYNIKWYHTGAVEFNVFCVDMLMKHDFLPTIEQYNLTWYWAEKAAKEEHERKVAFRASLPDKKRKAFHPPNPAKWFHRIFEYKWIIFGGCNG